MGRALNVADLVVLVASGEIGEVVETHRGGGMAKVKFVGGRVKWFMRRNDPRLRRVPTTD